MALLIVGTRISFLLPNSVFNAERYFSRREGEPRHVDFSMGLNPDEPLPSARELPIDQIEDIVAHQEAFWIDTEHFGKEWPASWGEPKELRDRAKTIPDPLADQIYARALAAQTAALKSLAAEGGRVGENVGHSEHCGQIWGEEEKANLPSRMHVALPKTEFFLNPISPADDQEAGQRAAIRFSEALLVELRACFGETAGIVFSSKDVKAAGIKDPRWEIALSRNNWRGHCASPSFDLRGSRDEPQESRAVFEPFLAQWEAVELRKHIAEAISGAAPDSSSGCFPAKKSPRL